MRDDLKIALNSAESLYETKYVRLTEIRRKLAMVVSRRKKLEKESKQASDQDLQVLEEQIQEVRSEELSLKQSEMEETLEADDLFIEWQIAGWHFNRRRVKSLTKFINEAESRQREYEEKSRAIDQNHHPNFFSRRAENEQKLLSKLKDLSASALG